LLRKARDLLDGSNELISAPGNGSDIPRCGRVVAERGANLSNAKIEPALEIDESFIPPYRFAQTLSRDHLSAPHNQTGEYLRGLRLQAKEHAIPPQLAACRIKLEKSESKAS
jgi:hypothetical protein